MAKNYVNKLYSELIFQNSSLKRKLDEIDIRSNFDQLQQLYFVIIVL